MKRDKPKDNRDTYLDQYQSIWKYDLEEKVQKAFERQNATQKKNIWSKHKICLNQKQNIKFSANEFWPKEKNKWKFEFIR